MAGRDGRFQHPPGGRFSFGGQGGKPSGGGSFFDFMGFCGSVVFPGCPEWQGSTGVFVRNPSEIPSFCPGLANGFETRPTGTGVPEVRWLALQVGFSSIRHTSARSVRRIKGFRRPLPTACPAPIINPLNDQLELPTSFLLGRGSWTVSPRSPGGREGRSPRRGFRGEQKGSSCLSSAGFGAAAPSFVPGYPGSALAAFSPARFTRWLDPSNSRIIEWWTSRSLAAIVVIGSLKIWSHWLNTRFELISKLRRS